MAKVMGGRGMGAERKEKEALFLFPAKNDIVKNYW